MHATKSHQNLLFLPDPGELITKRVQGGIATTDVLLSAHVGGNAELFPKILELHVAEGSTIADVTFGNGVFWRNVPKDLYNVKPSDIANGVDCRKLPYGDQSLDCVVLDPPYMEGFFRESNQPQGWRWNSFCVPGLLLKR